MVLFPPLHVDHLLGFALEAALQNLGLPLGGGAGMEVVQAAWVAGVLEAPGTQGSWQLG